MTCDKIFFFLQPIAIYKNDRGKVKTKEYIPPCKDVFFGKVILSKCASVTLTIGCTKVGQLYEYNSPSFPLLVSAKYQRSTKKNYIHPFIFYKTGWVI